MTTRAANGVILDRSAISRALAKAIAFKQCGQQRKAEVWAARLMYLLDTMDICNQDRLAHYASEWSKEEPG